MPKYTETQKRILEVLSDGQRHTREELLACMPDEMTGMSAVKDHISRLRIRMDHLGETIICELYYNKLYYRHVRLIKKDD